MSTLAKLLGHLLKRSIEIVRDAALIFSMMIGAKAVIG